MIGTIQERNRRLYVVIQNGGQLEYYPTIFLSQSFRAAYGNYNGEQVYDTGVGSAGIWRSMDNQRRYPLASNDPEFTEGVKLEVPQLPELEEIPNKEIEAIQMYKDNDELIKSRRGRKKSS